MGIIIKKELLGKIGLIFIGILFGLLILEIGMRIGGFLILYLQHREYPSSIEYGKSYKILALGESTTANLRIGQSSWPEELEIILNNRSKRTKFKVFNEGIPSTNTVVILSKLEDNLDKYQPNLIITMMGVNDLGLNYSIDDRLQRKPTPFKDFRVYKLTKRIIDGLKYNFQRKEGMGEQTKEEDKAKEKNLIEAVETDTTNPEAWSNLENFYAKYLKFEEFAKKSGN